MADGFARTWDRPFVCLVTECPCVMDPVYVIASAFGAQPPLAVLVQP